MHAVRFAPGSGFSAWRLTARALLQQGIAPADVGWLRPGEASLFAGLVDERDPAGASAFRVPREFPELADATLAHSDAQAPALVYRLLWRLNHGEPTLLQQLTDDDVMFALACEKSVRRDQHKMKAFVRFRELLRPDAPPQYVAWFEPEHFIVERVAPFFVRRFAGMHWALLTPYRSAQWDGEALRFGPGATRAEAPADDALEDLWRTYYASIFNPARLKPQAMTREMPVKYWKNLPEARLIPGLMRNAAPRAQAMVARLPEPPRKRIAAPVTVAPKIEAGSLDTLRAQARDCRRCELWKPATQTVFGRGPARAQLMLVGEQPGDQEDLAGAPFVGPAGQLLDRALGEAGLDRSALYVTNTVKHFKFEPRGKWRLHKRADADEQAACTPWLEAELALVQPALVLCLGAMAASHFMGKKFALLRERGRWFDMDGRRVLATVHPSYLLRLPDAARADAYAAFVEDLRRVAEALGAL